MKNEIPISEVFPNEDFLYFLMHVHIMSTEAEETFEGLKSYFMSDHKDVDRKSFDVIWSKGLYFIMIKYLSFYNEFNKMKALIPDTVFQRDVKKVLSNIKKKWPHMEDYRNEVLAHEFRRNGKSIFSLESQEYKIPLQMLDYKELVNAMGFTRLLLNKKYPDHFAAFEKKKLLMSKEEHKYHG